MNAPKRTQQPMAVWLQPSEIPGPPASFREKVLDCLGAKLAFAEVTRPVTKPSLKSQELVWRALWELAFRADESKEHAGRWYALPDLPLHTLQRFPNRVRGWADQVEEIGKRIRSAEAYGHPAHSLPLFLELQVGAKKMAELGTARRALPKRTLPHALAHSILERRAEFPKLADLPGLLRLYADYIEAVCKLTAHYAPKAPAQFKDMLFCALIDLVTRVTGKPRFEHIATLLTAAYAARGSEEIVDAHKLRMQYSRHSRRKK
jgi:hypothetical protein